MIRSPSQCPGTARSATSAGRSLIIDHVRDPAPALVRVGRCGLAQRPPGAQVLGQLPAQPAAALDVQRLVDRLVRHPHLRIVGEVHPQPAGDLFRDSGSSSSPAPPGATPGWWPASPAATVWPGPQPWCSPSRPGTHGRPLFAASSLLTVPGERPNRRAISRTPTRCARQIAMSSRSAKVNRRYATGRLPASEETSRQPDGTRPCPGPRTRQLHPRIPDGQALTDPSPHLQPHRLRKTRSHHTPPDRGVSLAP